MASTGAKTAEAWGDLLRAKLAASILPGEMPMAGQALSEAANFLLEAAGHREHGKPAILIRSASDNASDARRITRIAVVNRDVPFLVDSISRAIAAHGLAVDLLVHPILPVVRDTQRQLADLPDGDGADAPASGAIRESFIYIETDRIDARQRRALEAELVTTIADVRAAVADWPEMVAMIRADAQTLTDPEGAELLCWLAGGMMIFSFLVLLALYTLTGRKPR